MARVVEEKAVARSNVRGLIEWMVYEYRAGTGYAYLQYVGYLDLPGPIFLIQWRLFEEPQGASVTVPHEESSLWCIHDVWREIKGGACQPVGLGAELEWRDRDAELHARPDFNNNGDLRVAVYARHFPRRMYYRVDCAPLWPHSGWMNMNALRQLLDGSVARISPRIASVPAFEVMFRFRDSSTADACEAAWRAKGAITSREPVGSEGEIDVVVILEDPLVARSEETLTFVSEWFRRAVQPSPGVYI